MNNGDTAPHIVKLIIR